MIRTKYQPQPQNAVSLSGAGYSVFKSVFDVTTQINNENVSEIESTMFKSIRFRGHFIFNALNAPTYNMNVGFVLIQYKSGATISEVEQTVNQYNLEQLISALSSSDVSYKILMVKASPDIVVSNNNGTASQSAVHQIYKTNFVYKFPSAPLERAAEAGYASSGTIHEENRRIKIYAFAYRYTAGTSVSGVWEGSTQVQFSIKSSGRKLNY